LLGLDPDDLGVTKWVSRYESLGATDLGKLVVRCSRSEQILPPDLSPASLDYSSIQLRPGEVVTLLDFDHFVEQSSDFKPEAVLSTIGDLHDSLDRAYRKAVTPQALVKWGSEEQ